MAFKDWNRQMPEEFIEKCTYGIKAELHNSNNDLTLASSAMEMAGIRGFVGNCIFLSFRDFTDKRE